MRPVSISRQIQAIEILLGMATGARTKPRPTELLMLIEDATAALETLRWNERNADKLRRLIGDVRGARI